MEIEFNKYCKHLKTDKIYLLSDTKIINCTNKNDGEILRLYSRGGKIFAREENEFNAKFFTINN